MIKKFIPRLIYSPLRWAYYSFRHPGSIVSDAICFLGRLARIATNENDLSAGGRVDRQNLRHSDLVDFILRCDVSLDRVLLDVGCGIGFLLERLNNAGFKSLAACDWNEPSALLQSVRPYVAYEKIDLNVDGLSSYPNHSIDIIVASDVLEHLENPAMILREFERVLTTRGHIFITIPNAFNIFERLHILRRGNSSRYKSERGYGRENVFGHISMMPYWVFESLITRAGLDCVEKGEGYITWGKHFWFLNRRFSHLYSFNATYHLMRKTDLVELNSNA